MRLGAIASSAASPSFFFPLRNSLRRLHFLPCQGARPDQQPTTELLPRSSYQHFLSHARRSRCALLSNSRQLRTMASDIAAQAAPTSAGLRFTDLPQEIQKDIISHVSADRGPLPRTCAPAPSGRPVGIPLNHSHSAINQSSSACLSSPNTSDLWLPQSCTAISTLSSPTRTIPPSTLQ